MENEHSSEVAAEAEGSVFHLASTPELSIVFPCHNEAEGIEKLLRDWVAAASSVAPSLEIIVINDGSSDGTGRILDKVRKDLKSIRVIHQLNGGHARAIRRGYELARGRYIFQVDSNGQYAPADFLPFWERRLSYQLVLGVRHAWPEGRIRRMLTRLLHSWVKFLFGEALQDPNVPFRLFRREVATPYLENLPSDFEGINLTLSILIHRDNPGGVCEIPLPARPRISAKTRTSLTSFVSLVIHFFVEVTQLRFSRPKLIFSRTPADT